MHVFRNQAEVGDALCFQLCDASEDQSTKGKDRAKALGMSKKISSFEFVSQLALIRDILDVLHGLSLYLQKRDASILDAGDRFQTAMKTLKALKTCNGLSVALSIERHRLQWRILWHENCKVQWLRRGIYPDA